MEVRMREEKVLAEAVLVYPIKHNSVLLSYKPEREEGEHKIGEGFWNGYGGGIDPGNTRRIQAVKELYEECRLTALGADLEKAAICVFHNRMRNGEFFECRVHVYLLRIWLGKPRETYEMTNPWWVKFEKIAKMRRLMPADSVWLPQALEGKKLHVYAWYGNYQSTLLRPVVVEKVSELQDD